MILTKAFDKLVTGTPVCVMIRGVMEYAFSEDSVHQLSEKTARRQYARNRPFSQIVDLMRDVVCQVSPAIA